MTEPTETTTTVVNRPPVFAKFYHASGMQVSVPLGVGLDPAEVYRDLDNWLAAGWKPEPPGLEPGEQREEIGYVVRKLQESDRGMPDAVRLDLYANHEGMKFSVLVTYLDTDEDIIEFQKISGVKVQDIPLYSGTDKIERGKSRQADKFVFRLPRPIVAVWKPNPRYNEEEAKTTRAAGKVYKTPQRLFVRWDGQTASPPANGQQGPQTSDDDVVKRAKAFLDTSPPLDLVNEKYGSTIALRPGRLREDLLKLIAVHAQTEGWILDEQTARYVAAENMPAVVDGDEIPF